MKYPPLKQLCKLAVLLLTVLSAYPSGTAEPALIRNDIPSPGEYELKAIYLYNFLQFVQWPEDRCPLPGGRAYEIGVLGDSSLTSILRALKEKLSKQDRQLKLTFYGPYREDTDLSDCSLLFIAASELKNLPRILDKLHGRAVLTVADSDEFIDSGVMITLLTQENKVRWAINRKPVISSGLRMNAKLLDIAVRVID